MCTVHFKCFPLFLTVATLSVLIINCLTWCFGCNSHISPSASCFLFCWYYSYTSRCSLFAIHTNQTPLKSPTRLCFQYHKKHCARRGPYSSRAIRWTCCFLVWIKNVVLFVRGNCVKSSSSSSSVCFLFYFFIGMITMF